MKRDSKFRTFTGILALIIAMGVFPPVVSSADEIETDPTEAMYDAAPVNTVDFADVDESEEAESEVTGLEYETPDEGITDDPDDNTTDEDVPDDSDDTTGEDITDDPDDNTTGEDVPDDSDDTTGEDITDNTDDTTDEDVPDDPDDTTGEDITDNTDDTIDESITDEDIANDPDDETSDEIIIDDVGTEEDPEQDEDQEVEELENVFEESSGKARAEILDTFEDPAEFEAVLEALAGAELKLAELPDEDISELFVNCCGEEIQNYAAFDLGLYFGDEEVEPGAEAAVTVDLTDYLADQDYISESLVLYHHEENEWGEIIDTDAVASYEDGGITVDEETGAVTAVFTVNSFSGFTVVWNNNEEVVYYCDGGEDHTHTEECLTAPQEKTPYDEVYEAVVPAADAILEEAYLMTEDTSDEEMYSAYERMGLLYDEVYAAYDEGTITDEECETLVAELDVRFEELLTVLGELGFDPYGTAMLPADDAVTYDLNSDGTFDTVTADPAPGVTVKLFNYGTNISYDASGSDAGGNGLLGFMQGGAKPTVDISKEYKPGNALRGTSVRMKTDLVDGYPSVDVNGYGSLEYLFNGETDPVDEKKRTFAAEMQDGGGLFQKDENGYYEYDSAKNAAYYDKDKGEFVVYDDVIIRPNYTDNDGNRTEEGNFLPFNKLSEDTVDTDARHVHEYENSDGSVTEAYRLSSVVDIWFGMMIEFEFYMPKDGKINGEDMVFEFFGDDDVFVYIDDKLVLDIGSIHAAHAGSINFSTGKVWDHPSAQNDKATPARERSLKQIFGLSGDTFDDYTKHTLKFFYLERGANISYCKIRFNMPTLPNNSITVGKELTVQNNTDSIAIENILKDTLTYKFRVMDADTGKPITYDLDGNSISYKVYKEGAYDESDSDTYEIRTLGSDGIIELKSGERALIENTLDIFGEDGENYYVQELIPETISEQYADVQVDHQIDDTTVDIKVGDVITKYIGHQTDDYNSIEDGSTYSVFNNVVNTNYLGLFSVEKKVEENSNFEDGKAFKFQITFDGELLKKTEFIVSSSNSETSETRFTDEEGILTIYDGETAMLAKRVLSGTVYEVIEIDGEKYHAVYSVKDGEENAEVSETSGSGTFVLGSTVTVTVTNSSYDFGVGIPVTKEFIGNSAVDPVPFTFTLTQCDEDGNPVSNKPLLTKVIAVTGENVSKEEFFIGYTSSEVDEGEVFYYLIEEVAGADSSISYDPSVYIVGVKIEGGKAVIDSFTKGGKSVDDKVAAFINSCSTSVTIKKEVTGNMGDRSKEFTFTAFLIGSDDIGVSFTGITADEEFTLSDDSMTATFTLAHDESITFENVPIGATLVVTETAEGYAVYVNGSENPVPNGVCEHKVVADDPETDADENLIVYNNDKTAIIDTAVTLDYLPYIILFAIVGTGVIIAASDKRREADE